MNAASEYGMNTGDHHDYMFYLQKQPLQAPCHFHIHLYIFATVCMNLQACVHAFERIRMQGHSSNGSADLEYLCV